jgi:heptosyltransferase-1
MKILIVKLSSLGDVVHAMPAVQDIRAALPDATIDWVLERGFAPLAQRCEGVHAAIACDLRRWLRTPLSTQTRAEWRVFRRELREQRYDAVIDLQGLTKSALVARAARLTAEGRRFAMANQTDGAGYEAPTRWVADVAIRIEPRIHAVARSRELCARALGYTVPRGLRYGLKTGDATRPGGASAGRCVAFVHGTSRDDKCWPEASWIELARRLVEQGHTIALPHGSEAERERSERIAEAVGPRASVWPRLDLGSLADWMGGCAGVVGVDSGLSHIAVALNLPHVQIYNFDTAWRTGPDASATRQKSVFARPAPSVDAVWQAWREATAAP